VTTGLGHICETIVLFSLHQMALKCLASSEQLNRKSEIGNSYFIILRHIGLVSQTGLRVNQDQALVQLNVSSKKHCWCACILRQNNGIDIF